MKKNTCNMKKIVYNVSMFIMNNMNIMSIANIKG